jgi:hypothetical protein
MRCGRQVAMTSQRPAMCRAARSIAARLLEGKWRAARQWQVSGFRIAGHWNRQMDRGLFPPMLRGSRLPPCATSEKALSEAAEPQRLEREGTASHPLDLSRHRRSR